MVGKEINGKLCILKEFPFHKVLILKVLRDFYLILSQMV